MLFKQACCFIKIISDFINFFAKLAKNLWFYSYYYILKRIGIGYDEAAIGC
jgi:hypothetical protein